MTTDGQFLRVKAENKIPSIGEVFKGKVITKSSSFFKYTSIAASIFLALVILPFITLYFKPVTTVSIKINPHISLQANRWNRIVKVSALNPDGEEILKNISLKNKTIDTGLSLIVEEAKKDNYINEEYIESNKEISVQISSKNKLQVDLSEFKHKIEKEDLNVFISPIKNEASEGNINIIIDKDKHKEVKIKSSHQPKSQEKNIDKVNGDKKSNNDKLNINKNNIDKNNNHNKLKYDKKNNDKIIKTQHKNKDKINPNYKTVKDKNNKNINNSITNLTTESKSKANTKDAHSLTTTNNSSSKNNNKNANTTSSVGNKQNNKSKSSIHNEKSNNKGNQEQLHKKDKIDSKKKKKDNPKGKKKD